MNRLFIFEHRLLRVHSLIAKLVFDHNRVHSLDLRYIYTRSDQSIYHFWKSPSKSIHITLKPSDFPSKASGTKDLIIRYSSSGIRATLPSSVILSFHLLIFSSFHHFLNTSSLSICVRKPSQLGNLIKKITIKRKKEKGSKRNPIRPRRNPVSSLVKSVPEKNLEICLSSSSSLDLPFDLWFGTEIDC